MATNQTKEKTGSGDIAIIGMGCTFPKAPDSGAYWRNIVSKTSAIDFPPADRLIDEFYDPASNANDRIYCRRGGYIDDLTDFNPIEFGIMPLSIEGAEPEHYLALRTAAEALKDAGFGDKPFNRENFEVILGRGTFVNRGYVSLLQHGFMVDQTISILKSIHPEYSSKELTQIKHELKSSLPPFNAEVSPGLASSVMTGIIANRMDLHGRNYTVDAACASGLIALENATQDLLSGSCDAALVGAVQVSTPAVIHMIFTQLGALTRHDALRPFSSDADGTMLGEGIGMVVLKRLEDAVKDGHRIYAVIKGVGSSSDGRAKGLLAPRPEGEELALRRAYTNANINPSTIGLVEAHGTALPLGDATEIGTLNHVFGGRHGVYPKCALGSVKSMIGHLIPASSIASLIKTAHALYHKTLPPTLNCEQPNDALTDSHFYLNSETRPWVHGNPDYPRRAGINAFGFGGINTHAILEEHQTTEQTWKTQEYQWESELFVFAANDRPSLIAQIEQVINYLQSKQSASMGDLSYSLWKNRSEGYARLALTAHTKDDLLKKLSQSVERLKDPERSQIKDRRGIFYNQEPLATKGKIAFLFPGEGSQYINMLADLSRHFPPVLACFDLLDRAFIDHARGFLPSEVVFPPPMGDTASEDRLWSMDGAVDAVITADRALYRLLKEFEITPDAILGHSSGEIMALEAAGAIEINDDEDLIRYIKEGNQMIENLNAANNIPDGQLLAVGGISRQEVDALIQESDKSITLAMENCPHQFVLCGSATAAQWAKDKLAKAGGLCQLLPFARAYHTHHFERALGPLRDFFSSLPITAPSTPIYSCLSAGKFPNHREGIEELAVMQWARPVRFLETITQMHKDGVRLFIEVGPRANLTGFANDILKDKEGIAVATNSHHKSGLAQLQTALAQLYANGVSMNLDILYKHRDLKLIDTSIEIHAKPTKATGARTVKLKLGLPIMSLGENAIHFAPQSWNPSHTGEAVQEPGQISHISVPTIQDFAHKAPTSQSFNAQRQTMFKSYMDTMDSFLDVQAKAAEYFFDSHHGNTATVFSIPGVELIHFEPGAVINTRIKLSPDNSGFLKHHTLGGNISRLDPQLLALPLCPLSMALELMADTASKLNPKHHLTRMSDIRTHGWIALYTESLILTCNASVRPHEQGTVQVELYNENHKSPVVVATMHFGKTPPNPMTDNIVPNENAVEKRMIHADIYPDALFHGPYFRSIQDARFISDDGIDVDLKAPVQKGLFNKSQTPSLTSDPILVDTAGQAVGLWAANHFANDFVIFPIAIDEIRFFGSPLAEKSVCTMTVSCRQHKDDSRLISSDADIRNSDGSTHIALRGLHHRRIKMPAIFHDFRKSRSTQLSSQWNLPVAKLPITEKAACRITTKIPAEFWDSDGGIWRDVLAYIILSRQERKAWQQLNLPCGKKTEWLLGRLAAKEATRQLVQNHGEDAWLADIEICKDNSGQPSATAEVAGKILSIAVSITHSDGVAAAIASAQENLAVGLDVESSQQLSTEFRNSAFSVKERSLLPTTLNPEQQNQLLLKMWSAKEATAKALGSGLKGNPGNLEVVKLDLPNNKFYLQLSGKLVTEFPSLAEKELEANVFEENRMTGACTLLPI